MLNATDFVHFKMVNSMWYEFYLGLKEKWGVPGNFPNLNSHSPTLAQKLDLESVSLSPRAAHPLGSPDATTSSAAYLDIPCKR